jgi:hypothetical protein
MQIFAVIFKKVQIQVCIDISNIYKYLQIFIYLLLFTNMQIIWMYVCMYDVCM